MSSDSECRYSGTRMRPARSSQSLPGRQPTKAQAVVSAVPWSLSAAGASFSCSVADSAGVKRTSSWPASRLSVFRLPSWSLKRR